jgi:hypothetical protein
MHEVLRQAYGIDRPDEQWVRTDLPLRDQFPCLDPTLDVRPPTAPNLNDGFEQLLDQVMNHVYPAHPRFDEEVRIGDLRTALKHVERAVGERDQRVDIPQPDRKAVRKVLGPLKVATVGESHVVLDRHWRDHFHRMQQQNPGVPLTVERLKRWMDDPKPMGLDDKVANFVICAYALMDNRVLVHGGADDRAGRSSGWTPTRRGPHSAAASRGGLGSREATRSSPSSASTRAPSGTRRMSRA